MKSTISRDTIAASAVILALALVSTARLLAAQLPPPLTLSEQDSRGFHEELTRLQGLLPCANDKGAVELQIANTYAAGGQYKEAVVWLRRVVDADLGFDPSRDPDFAKIRNTVELQTLIEQVRHQTPRVSSSRSIATIQAPSLFPENMAVDPATRNFFFGNTANDELVRCGMKSGCVPFVRSQEGNRAYTLGIKLDPRSGTLWATNNAADKVSLRQYDLNTGKRLRIVQLDGKHVFNDIALSSSGTAYVTDTEGAAVYALEPQSKILRRLAPDHRFTAANGIAFSHDEKTLFVSAWADGIDAIDPESGWSHPFHIPQQYVCRTSTVYMRRRIA